MCVLSVLFVSARSGVCVDVYVVYDSVQFIIM